MSNNKKAIELLNQIIEQSEYEDYLDKKLTESVQGAPISGESWLTFHLKVLKELLQNKPRKKKSNKEA